MAPYNSKMSRLWLAPIALLCFANCLLAAQSLQIQSVAAQGAIVGENFLLPLQVTGGTQAYTWQLVSGALPPGCKLHPHAGNVSGIPTTAGDYHFTLSVSDSSIPQQQVQRDFTVHVIAGLTIDWKDGPTVRGAAISGSVVASNQTGEDFDLTVIVVAVNQIGRATTLGYMQFKLPAGATQAIEFGGSPGPETYYVRADAAAHHLERRRVYRASKQTPPSITISQF